MRFQRCPLPSARHRNPNPASLSYITRIQVLTGTQGQKTCQIEHNRIFRKVFIMLSSITVLLTEGSPVLLHSNKFWLYCATVATTNTVQTHCIYHIYISNSPPHTSN